MKEAQMSSYQRMTVDQAVEQVIAFGHTAGDAAQMVGEYLDANTARWGEPAGGWLIDDHDLAEIERAYEWVDHYAGESLAAARERAGEYASDWTAKATNQAAGGPDGGHGRVRQAARLWTQRATAVLPPAQPHSGYDTSTVVDHTHRDIAHDHRDSDGGEELAAAELAGLQRAEHNPFPDEVPMTGAEVVDRLVAAGHERGDAAGLVRGYLDATSAEVGVPVHRWGLDEHDVAHIIARYPGGEDHDGAGQLDGGRVDLGALAERVTRLRGAQISDQTASTNGATTETGRSDTAIGEHTDEQEWTR